MNRHKDIVNYLGGSHSDDYWADVGIEHGIKLANELSDTDWKVLEQSWETLDDCVQIRLAEICSEVSTWSHPMGKMLVAMLGSASNGVVEASVDSLHAITRTAPERVRQLDLLNHLDRVKLSGPVALRVLSNLKSKLS